MLGMMQAYRNVMRYLDSTSEVMHTNRKVCLLFHQLERDFSSAFIPELYEEVKKPKSSNFAGGTEESDEIDKPEDEKSSDKRSTKNTAEAQEEAKKKAEKKAQLRKSYFIAAPDDRTDPIKIGDKRFELFKNVTLICSNPLQVYGEKIVRLVRVNYELTVDKQRSKGDILSYKLWRKETADLANIKCIVDDSGPAGKAKLVRTHLVADNLKSFFIEYVLVKQKKKSDKNLGFSEKKEDIEKVEMRSFAWGNKKEFEGIVPQRIEVRVEFWNDALTTSQSYGTVFPIYSFPTMKEKKKKKKEKDKAPVDQGEAKQGTPVEWIRGSGAGNGGVAQVQDSSMGPQSLQGNPAATQQVEE